VFLAGGLTPDNVRDSVAATQPFAVDVCRGVERSPGVKDTDAVARFIAEARR
jgi:phosphoribosylanthranilate isomerase